MELSREQKIAFDKYIEGNNIFITGPGGSGKTELIRLIRHHADSHHKDIHVCALTGCAAVLLNCKAKTLHSWAGIQLGNGTIEQLIKKVRANHFAKALWKQTDILIVDEVSMLSLKLFTSLNAIGKAMRGSNKPFGGIQLIFSGDFYQLPPVGDKYEPDTTRFCFESEDWNLVFPRNCQIQLVKIFRQTDEIFSTILNQIREGKIKRKVNDLLIQYVNREYSPDLIIEPTKLFPTRNKVDNLNKIKMESLNGEDNCFSIQYVTDIEMTATEKNFRQNYLDKDIQIELDYLSGNLLCEKNMILKIGAQVMCIVNIRTDFGLELCNGSQGIVKRFCPTTGFPYVKYNNGKEVLMSPYVWRSEKIPGIGIKQVPLILAWALTIHKSQGATMDAAEIDAGSSIFECGQTYVALSRVKSLNGLYLSSFDVKRIKINKKVQDYYDALKIYQLPQSNKIEEYEAPTIHPTENIFIDNPIAESTTKI